MCAYFWFWPSCLQNGKKCSFRDFAKYLHSKSPQPRAEINPSAQRGKKKNYKPLCSALVIVFYLAYLALAGLMNLLAQLSDRIIHFSEYNLMPLAFLTKLSIMH